MTIDCLKCKFLKEYNTESGYHFLYCLKKPNEEYFDIEKDCEYYEQRG